MVRLHTFGCSITQGFALPDVVRPILGEDGVPLTEQQIKQRRIQVRWNDIHVYEPSQFAWPAVLAERLGMQLTNHARRGACFQQIARQCAVGARDIQPEDTVIVMWTYLSRVSLQWPARTAVPLCNILDPLRGWSTVTLGFNKLFGLSPSDADGSHREDAQIQKYIRDAAQRTYMDPRGIYNRYYNNMVLQQMTDGFLRATGARVIHLSVEYQTLINQLEHSRQTLSKSLKEPYVIPHPEDWYSVPVDYNCWRVLFDPAIPLAENDMHPSVAHHRNFAGYVYDRYFRGAA